MDLTESPLLDDESMTILQTGYLLRPPTRAALRAALTTEPAHFDATVDALLAAGFLTVGPDDTLAYESPYATFIALGRLRAMRMHEETLRTTALMQALPQLIRAWDLSEVGEGEEHPLSVNIIHAKPSSWEEWFRHSEAEQPTRPSVVFTDPEVAAVSLRSGHLEVLQGKLSDAVNVRVLLPVGVDWSDEILGLVRRAKAAGIEFRTSRRTTSWLYVDEPSLVGLPIMWGAGTPTSALAIRTPPVVAAVAMLFEELWARGAPFRDDAEGWVQILGMLGQGMTDDAIARVLGLTTRTVRRRIAEAMAELGATSRFTLGTAWQARHLESTI